MEVEWTKHAEDMLIERGFDREFIVQVVLNPDWTEERSETEWHAFKRVGNKVRGVDCLMTQSWSSMRQASGSGDCLSNHKP